MRCIFRIIVTGISAATLIHPSTTFAAGCAGDCDGDGSVTVEELIIGVSILLDQEVLSRCPSLDRDESGVISINELVTAVGYALGSCPTPTETATPTTTEAPIPSPATATPSVTNGSSIPTNADDLVAWLQGGNYLAWSAESGPHPSAGPHFGTVRTFLNEPLFASLAAGGSSHPAHAAAVKELFGSGSVVLGWAAMVKLQPESANGAGWYWFEYYRGRVLASGTGLAGCAGCHSAGRDFIRIPFPLQ